MSIIKHLFGQEAQYRGELFGRLVAANTMKFEKYELSCLVDEYEVAGAYQFLCDFVKGYNACIKEKMPDLKTIHFSNINPYKLGEQLAEAKQLLPEGAIETLVKDEKPWRAKAALILITDGYNDKLKTLSSPEKAISPEKNR